MRPVGPILVTVVYERLHRELQALLAALPEESWARPVPGSRWSVKDVAAHLLDGDLRRLCFQRDRWPPPKPDEPITGYGDLVDFLNRLNEEWLRAARRLSPRVLTELLAWTGGEVCRLFASLDPEAPALFPVAWAAEESSPNWFDVAREYTEKWVHQRQIRDAVGRPGADGAEYLRPLLDTFLRAVPHGYREVAAPEGAAVALRIEGEGGGVWSVRRQAEGWRLWEGAPEEVAATLTMSAETAWRALSTRRRKGEHLERVEVTGDPALAEGFARATAVMA